MASESKEPQQRQLQETFRKLLSIARLVITSEWNYLADDWVTCIAAADIDDDSDIEIVAGSRDGYVRALTRQGTERWKKSIGSWITSIAVIPSPSVQDLGEDQPGNLPQLGMPLLHPRKAQPRIIVCTRDGRVCALDQEGELLKWGELAERQKGGQALYQVVVHPRHPNEVIVGGEDRFVRLIDATTGHELGKYALDGWVYGVCVADVDGDGEEEILAVSADKYIHILSRSSTPTGSIECIERGKIKLAYKSYALAVIEQGASSNDHEQHPASRKRPTIIFSSDKGKDLRSWTVANQVRGQMKGQLIFNKKLPRAPRPYTLQGRVLTIHTADVDNDGQLEILVGSADHFLSIFDQRGQTLWQQDFGHNIYSIYACDYDDDGIIEIILGLGDNNIRAFKIELDPERYDADLPLDVASNGQPLSSRPALYLQMQQTAEKLHRQGVKELLPAGDALAELINNLGLLQNGEKKHKKGELALAEMNLKHHQYEEALSLSLRLKEQRVQHYWDEPLTNLGHIRDIGFGDVKGNPIDEIIIGTDEGEFIALDINNEKKELWASRGQAGSSVISLSTNNPHPAKGYETTLAALENGEISYIDNEGRDIDLPAHLLEAGERVTSLYVETSFVEGVHQLAHIALGLESQQICLYNAVQGQRQVMIPTAANTAMLYIGDILGQKRLDILTATVEHTVVLYTQDQQDPAHYTECWHYQTEDHIRGLRAVDIDRDGHVEIIIGSEDRNLYVLNHLGELKWRYFMPDGVFSVDVCKLNHDDQEYEILAGVDDGFIYILNSQGDLLLQIPVGDRVRVVRAKDLHPRDSQDSRHRYLPDNMVEIAVATDDRLLLFQILPLATIRELIEQSWFFVGNNIEPRELLYTYSDYQKQPDEYVRAFAIERIAGQRTHTDEDFKHLRTAVAKDPSLLVAQKLANAIVNLCRTSSNKREMRQSHQLLQQLARKPQRETRITIINVLDELALVNKRLSFEYLKRFLRNEDLWLRRMVIRQLHCLVKLDPAQVFSMLMTSTRDKNLWILQETGRSLASYFDYRHEHSAAADGDSDPAIYQGRTLLQDLHELLSTALDVTISKQIAISSKEPAIKQFFSAYARFQQAIFTRLPRSRLDNSLESLRQEERFKLFQEQKKGYQDDLTAFISALQDMLQIMPQIEDMLVVYQELLNVLQVTSIESIEQLRRKTESAEMYAFSHFKDIDATLVRMLEVVDEIKRYRKRQALGDQAATLLVAINLLSQIRQQYIEGRSVHSTQELLPEDALFRIALQQWYALLQKELRKLSGAARLSIELVPNEVQRDETVELSFNLTNTGKSAADAVRVTIPERSSDYEVIGSVERTLPEVSTLRAQTVSFILKPLAESFRLSTEVTYNDAEKRDRVQRQPHYINLKPVRAEFKTIVNPYHGGTPTSDSKMFYGREEDLNSLRDILGSTNARANRVILLIGQRRSGKTSLIYQLANQLQMHIAVHIDLQDLAMSNGAAELFSNFALKIQEAMFLRGFTPPPLNEFNFRENSTQTFDRYLKLSTQQLGGQRLILLFDEFEVFNELIQQKRLDENFLHYLRSLMQHRLGVNFLLAGAPHVLLYDINNRSALLNIAQKHHLSRLKEEEAAHLITDPVQNLVYDPQALELIHQLTGDQPYLIHLLCEELIYYCNKYKKNYANTNDINKIVDKVLERGDNYFWMIWKLASSREERLILTLLAGEADAGQGGIFSLVDLKKAFDDLNCSCDAEKMRQALSHLQQEEIIEGDNDGQIFSIPVDLIRIWLCQHTTPERIARDEFLTGE